ncbi:MAG: hypothetical protein HYX84_01735 [Chloroflexi bacterium]|nr:hypothetical protein [Chloroflexota bacterium]
MAEVKFLLEELRKQLLAACIHFEIWEQTFPTQTVVETLNWYRGFFLPTREAHLDRFIIKVSIVVENDRRAPSFYRLFGLLRNCPALVPSVNALSRRLRKHRKVLAAIKEYRDARAAHWNAESNRREGAQRKPVLFGESRRMLKELQSMFNEISVAHSGSVWVFEHITRNYTTSLLDALKSEPGQLSLQLIRETKMSERDKREFSRLTVRKHELEQRLRKLEGTAELVDGLREPPVIMVTTEKLKEIESIRKEIDKVTATRKEIIESNSKLRDKR